jgi:Putative ATPase subunit of terminase (gpP-like)
MAYVKESDMSSALLAVFDLMRQEPDFEQRAILLKRLHRDLESESAREIRHIAYGLRFQGWDVRRVKEILGLTERTIHRYVTEYARLTGEPMPKRPKPTEPPHFVIYAPSPAARQRADLENQTRPLD